MNLVELALLLADYPSLASGINLEDLVGFFDIICLLKPQLSLYSVIQDSVPERLPIHIHEFICVSLKLNDSVVKLVWEMLREIAWAQEHNRDTAQKLAHKYLPLFLDYGIPRGIGMSVSTTSTSLADQGVVRVPSVLRLLPANKCLS